ncbi:MAG: hypothetical protein R2880_05395 [Deinococcales bacterium]
MQTLIRWLATEFLLGTLVATLSILAALSGYQNAMANSNQTKYNVEGQQLLTDANAEYLASNQLINYDYSLYDGFATSEDLEKNSYYQQNFSEALQQSLLQHPDDPFGPDYYAAMATEASKLFEDADKHFSLAEDFNNRGDALQLIMLISSLGLSLSAWASLLKRSGLKAFFALIAIGLLGYALLLYGLVPKVVNL